MNTTCIDHGLNKESASLPAMVALIIAVITGNFRPAIEAQAPEGYEVAPGSPVGFPYVKAQSGICRAAKDDSFILTLL
jgi:hypothetical protein